MFDYAEINRICEEHISNECSRYDEYEMGDLENEDEQKVEWDELERGEQLWEMYNGR